jgi:hypothetical protein
LAGGVIVISVIEKALALIGAAALGLGCGALIGILGWRGRARRFGRDEIPQTGPGGRAPIVGVGRGDERPAA